MVRGFGCNGDSLNRGEMSRSHQSLIEVLPLWPFVSFVPFVLNVLSWEPCRAVIATRGRYAVAT